MVQRLRALSDKTDARQSAATGASPIDVAVSNDDRFLYVLTAGDQSISQYRIAADGSLTSLGAIGGLSVGTVGLVAR